MKKLLTTVAAIALVAMASTAPRAEFLGFGKTDTPLNLDDAASVTKMLNAMSSSNGAYLFLDGEGKITLCVKMSGDNCIYGRGTDLKMALEQLASRMSYESKSAASAVEGIRAILNQGKPSQ